MDAEGEEEKGEEEKGEKEKKTLAAGRRTESRAVRRLREGPALLLTLHLQVAGRK